MVTVYKLLLISAMAHSKFLKSIGGDFFLNLFTLCYSLLFCTPFSGGYIASAQPVTRPHWMPATWIGLSPISR